MGLTFNMDHQSTLLHHHQQPHDPTFLSYDREGRDHFDSGSHFGSFSFRPADHYQQSELLFREAPTHYAFGTADHGRNARSIAEREEVPGATSYQHSHHLVDSSDSLSPVLATSPLPHTNFHHTNAPPFPVQPPSSYAPSRSYSNYNGLPSVMPPPPSRRTDLQQGYGHYADSPRSASTSTGLQQSLSPADLPIRMASTSNYGPATNGSGQLPWPQLECLQDITCEGQPVTPEIIAKTDKGFFPSLADQKWTCYRRNYFQISCSFELHPTIPNGRLFLKRDGNNDQIQAMGLRLAASIDGSGGKSIELVVFTTKRDNGPRKRVEIVKMSPTPTRNAHTAAPHGVYQLGSHAYHATGAVPGPHLPLQNIIDDGTATAEPVQTSANNPYGATPISTTSHAFDRIQFKQATANNGKRRASQQYFHLHVELFADVRKENSRTPVWVKVAQRISEKVVVRGRSPSHYQAEGQHGPGQGGRGGSTSGGSGYISTNGQTYGSMNPGAFRSANGGYGSGTGSGSGYRHHNGLETSPDDYSGTTPDSMDDSAGELERSTNLVLSEGDRVNFTEAHDYNYLRPAVYTGNNSPTQLPPISKIESAPVPHYYTPNTSTPHFIKPEFNFNDPIHRSNFGEPMPRFSFNDPMPNAHWQTGNCGRWVGDDGSTGYYPPVSSLSAPFS